MSLSNARSSLALAISLAAAAGCANPTGNLTVTSHYSGPCTIDFTLGSDKAGDPIYQPLATGDDQPESVGPGLVDIGVRAKGAMCAGGFDDCAFVGSMNVNTDDCVVYVAGELFSGTMDIVDGPASQCSGGETVTAPKLVCSPQ